MVKHISIIYRAKGKTHAEAVKYWREVHQNVVKGRLPGLRKYVGNFPVQDPDSTVKQPGGGQQMTCDAIVELHFDDLESLTRAMSSEAWQSDERRASSAQFMDYAQMTYVVVDEESVRLN